MGLIKKIIGWENTSGDTRRDKKAEEKRNKKEDKRGKHAKKKY